MSVTTDFAKDWREDWSLSLVHDKLRFLPRGKVHMKESARLTAWGDFAVTDKTTIQVWFGRSLKGRPDEQKAVDGWYLTADYSADPPRVILTKEKTEDSEWEFVLPRHGVKRGEGQDYYIKNVNDDDDDEYWLSVEDASTPPSDTDWRPRRPILSKEPLRINVNEAAAD